MTLLYSNDILETNSHILLKIAQFFEGWLGLCETLAHLCNVDEIEFQYS